jgi:general secretion pathway protein B
MSKSCSLPQHQKGFSCMSLILDALNRAENERKNHDTVPDLNTMHRARDFESKADGRHLLWWVVGAVVATVAIIMALILLLRPVALSQPEQVTANQPPTAVEQQAPAVNANTPGQYSVVNSAAQVAVPVVEPVPKAAAPTAAVESLYAAEDATPVKTVDSGVNELYAAEAATTASETIVDPFSGAGTPTAVSTAVGQQAPPRTYDSITNIPDFNSLPWNMRQRVPTISYARHNYLAGGVSSVVINNQTTGVGNIIGAGQFIVQEIYVDGVVLKHGDIVFKLRALTGWINM